MTYRRSFDAEKVKVRAAVEEHLQQVFSRYPPTEVRQVAEYVTLGGGHRWRAILAVAAGRVFANDVLAITLPSACSIELTQAATLILDDLPSMDDARLCRGKPCAHLVFPDWAVDLAPAFLLTLAYEISLDNPRVSPDRRVWAAVELSRAGLTMIAGQADDGTRPDEPDGDLDLIELARLKAGAFYAASTMAGGILCGASEDEAAALYDAGLNLGLAYQMLDDVADITASVAEVGKEPGADAGKFTVVDWLGVEGAQQKGAEYVSRSLAAIEHFGPDASWLRSIITEASWKAY